MSTSSRSVLITGCTKGSIGYALARAYQDQGYLVFASARRLAAMEGLPELGINTLELDVTKPETIKEAGQTVRLATGGTLDILVNNAGQVCPGAAVETPIEATQRVFDINVFGVMRMCQEFVDPLIKAQGKIINIGSIAALFVWPFASSYNATKAALQQYSETLRIELEPFGVSVTTVVTGAIQSNIWQGDPDLTPDSRYWLINDQYVKHRQNEASGQGATDTDVYARWVVSKTAHKKGMLPIRLHKGLYATIVWLLDCFAPRWFFMWFVQKKYGVDKLQERLRASGWTPANAGT